MENTKCIAREQGGGGTSWVSFFFIFPFFCGLVTFKREKIKIVMMRQHIGKGKNCKNFCMTLGIILVTAGIKTYKKLF